MGKTIDVPRYQKTYLKTYKFKGMDTLADPILPDCLIDLFDWAKNEFKTEFNQVLVNWYINGHDYIGLHSDDEKDIVKYSNIFSLTIAEENCERIFRIKNNNKRTVADIILSHGDFIIMGGHFQQEFKHTVPKISGKKGENCGKRINITFRQLTN